MRRPQDVARWLKRPGAHSGAGGPAGRSRERDAYERTSHPNARRRRSAEYCSAARRHRRGRSRAPEAHGQAGTAHRPNATTSDCRRRGGSGRRRPPLPAGCSRPGKKGLSCPEKGGQAGPSGRIQSVEDTVLEEAPVAVGGAQRRHQTSGPGRLTTPGHRYRSVQSVRRPVAVDPLQLSPRTARS